MGGVSGSALLSEVQEGPTLELIEGTRTCTTCNETFPLSSFNTNNRLKSGRTSKCRPCAAAYRRELRAKRAAERGRAERTRKLPPYAELRKLYVDKSMSMAEIAAKYDVSKSAVYWTLRRRAENRGEWPLQPRSGQRAVLRRTIDRRLVQGWFIVDMVYEYCRTNNMTVKQFCDQHGFTDKYIYEVHSKRYKRISAQYAIRLLTAIGEPVSEHLQSQATLLGRKYTNWNARQAPA